MNPILDFSNRLLGAMKLIYNQMKIVNDLMIKSDDENLDKLLKRPEDKVKFQKAVDELMKDSLSKNVELNGKNITISI